MNLICCSQKCKHQQEGYCTLDQISRLTSVSGSQCGYFEPHQPTQPDSAQNSQRVSDGLHR